MEQLQESGEESRLKRQCNLLDYALSSLWRRKGKNLGVFCIFSGVIFLFASFQMTTSALTGSAELLLAHAPEILVQRLIAGRQATISLDSVAKLSRVYGIRAMVDRVWGYYYEPHSGANVTVVGLPEEGRNEGLGKVAGFVRQGRTYSRPGEVVLGRAAADIFGVLAGDQLILARADRSAKTVLVTGILDEASDLIAGDTMVMASADARDLFGMESDAATDLLVFVANPMEIDTIAAKITATLPGVRVVTRPQIQKTYRTVFGWRSGFASVCLLAAMAAFAILAWDKASGMTAAERREIAILKILGWQTGDILAVRFWEALVVAGFSFLAGVTLAYLHVALGDAMLFKPMLAGWSVLRPSLRLAPDFQAKDALLIISFTLVPYLAATVVPAWKCAIVPPDSVIR